MFEGISDKLTEYMGAIEKAMPAVVSKVGEAASKAWEITLTVKRIEGIGSLLLGIAFVTISVFVLRRMGKWFDELKKKGDEDDFFPVGIFLGIPSVIVFFCGIGELIDIWNWASIFVPEAAIAHDVWLKVTETTSTCGK